MKHCPRCNRTYTDAQQAYCSVDGVLLEDDRFKSPSPSDDYAPPTAWPGDMPPPPPYGWKSNPNMVEAVRPTAPRHQQSFPLQPYPPRVMSPVRNQDMAVVALIMGAVSIICFPVPFGQIALVLGLMALRKENKDPAHYGGKPLAITGTVIGAFTTLIMLVMLLFILMGAMLG